MNEFNPKRHLIGWKKGGFQDARGSTRGAEWFIEVILFFHLILMG